MNGRIKKFKMRKGITLIELLIVLPLISIILIITYNMLLLSNKSFKYTSDNFIIGEDIRAFVTNIQKEANQAKKSNEDTVLQKPSGKNHKEIYIYTDIDNDDIPELVRYRLLDNKIVKSVERATNKKYPYKYDKKFTNEQVVLSNVINEDIFGEIERVDENKKYQDENDHRRKVKMTIKVSTGKNNTPILINTVLIAKSRAEFDN